MFHQERKEDVALFVRTRNRSFKVVAIKRSVRYEWTTRNRVSLSKNYKLINTSGNTQVLACNYSNSVPCVVSDDWI